MPLNINTDILEGFSLFSYSFLKKAILLVLFGCGLTQRKGSGIGNYPHRFPAFFDFKYQDDSILVSDRKKGTFFF